MRGRVRSDQGSIYSTDVSSIHRPAEKSYQPDEFEIAAKRAAKQLGYQLLCWWRDPKGHGRVWFHAVRTVDSGESTLLCLSAPAPQEPARVMEENSQGGSATSGVERYRHSWHRPEILSRKPARSVAESAPRGPRRLYDKRKHG